MTAPLIFLDCETTGLGPDDEVWEVAAVRVDGSGQSTLHVFVEHDLAKAARLPDSFRADHDARYRPAVAIPRTQLCTALIQFFRQPADYSQRAHVVGCVPNFDTEHLARILRANGDNVPWHHHLMDVETLAIGWLRGLGYDPDGVLLAPPWDSDALSRAVGVEPPGDGVRHTAMGDVKWCMALYNRVMGADR